MVHLEVHPQRACAFCPLIVSWPDHTPEKWDYLELTSDDSDRLWEWLEGKSQVQYVLGPPGPYVVRYYSDGGYLTTGKLECSVSLAAVNPFRSLSVRGSMEAGSALSLSYALDFGSAPPRPLFLVLAKDNVILHSVSTSAATGTVQLPAPRVEGPCRVALQGTMDRCTALGSQGFIVVMPPEKRARLSFVEPPSGFESLAQFVIPTF